MSMRFKIFQSVPFTDSKGVTYRNHKIFIKNKPYWFSEKEYVNYPELLLINDNYIHIQETQKDLYEIILQSNQIGEFNTIVPISPINSKSANDSPMIHEPVTLGSILRSNKPGLKKLKLNHAKNQKHDDLTQDVIKQSNDLQIDFIGDDLAETDESHISEYNEEEVVKAKSKEKLQEVDHSRRLKIPKNVITALGKSLRNKDAVLSDIDIYHFSGIIEITLTDKTSKVEYVGYPTIEAQQINIEDFFDGDALSTLEKIFGDGVFDENGRLVTNISMINKILPNYSIGLRIPSANELEKIKAGHQLLSQEQKEVNSGQKSLNDLNQDLERTISSVEEIDKIEPDNKSETFKGNKINPTSSFKRKLATFKENNPTDPSNIFPEDFLDINDLFPEEIEENEKKLSLNLSQKFDSFKSKQNQQTIPLDAKIQFINGLVSMASRDKVNDHLRERLVSLVSKELEGQKGHEDKILDEINNIKKILIDGLGPITIPPEPGRRENPHTPRSTAIFLSNFKYDNDSRLKELIHSPDELHNIDSGIKEGDNKPDEVKNDAFLNDLLLTVKNHPALSSAYGFDNKSNFESIHLEVRSAVIILIKEFQKVLSNQQKGKVNHPFAQSPAFRRYAEEFKRNFRFGSGEFDTKLSSVIKTAAIGTISSFKYDLIFDQENVFDIKASFFSWLPSIRRSITHIFNEINTHSNINGSKTFEGKKTIRVIANVYHDSEMIDVIISDELSISSNAPVKVLKDLRNSSLALDINLKALCNWSVFMDFGDEGYELRVLSDKRNEWEIEPIVKLDSPNNAFINKLSFYRI